MLSLVQVLPAFSSSRVNVNLTVDISTDVGTLDWSIFKKLTKQKFQSLNSFQNVVYV